MEDCQTSKTEAGLYIHVPFCESKCPYCDFNSVVVGDPTEPERYLTAVRHELALRWESELGCQLASTVYVGGGTPTVLDGHQLADLIAACRQCAQADAELTIEANPGTLDEGKLSATRLAGVNRLSLGIQSLDSSVLRTLGRIHSVRQARESYFSARQAGFNNIGVDLIFGIPGQEMEQWERTIREIVSWVPEHISTYSLTIEEGTEYWDRAHRGTMTPVADEVAAEMLERCMDVLTEAGYEHYEISNFALPGLRCRHNQLYWQDGDYLGLGAGAHSSIGGRRTWNEPEPAKYTALIEKRGSAVVGEENLPPRRRMGETLLLGLRMADGVDLAAVGRRYQSDVEEVFGEALSKLEEQGLMRREGSRVQLTRRGLMLANEAMMEFVEAEE